MKPPIEQIDLKPIFMLDVVLSRKFRRLIPHRVNAMQLRILAAVSEASKEAANTIIMALPLETLKYAGIGDLGALASINSSAARKRVEEASEKKEQ